MGNFKRALLLAYQLIVKGVLGSLTMIILVTSVSFANINLPPSIRCRVTSAKIILDILKTLNCEFYQTRVMDTHEPENKKYVDRAIWLNAGLLSGTL